MAAQKPNGSRGHNRPTNTGREFWASTPAVSPSQRLNYEGAGNPIPYNQTVRVDQTILERTVCRNANPSTPLSLDTDETRQQNDLLSPIDRLEGTKLIHTMLHRGGDGGNDSLMPNTAQRPKTNIGSSFPFPAPACMLVPPVDKYETLLESLQILKCLEPLQDDDFSQDIQEQTGVIGRKVGSGMAVTQSKDFKFSKDMFKSNNSEAFIQVTHFLFTMLDKPETSIRFRNAWPIYEKKQESLYRRAALDWFKEIMNENPRFFSRSVKVEQLQGLVVNPYGDRFIKFMHRFADFVMNQVTSREENLDDPLLDKPAYTGNPEVTKRQASILGTRIVHLDNCALNVEKQRVLELTRVNELTDNMKKSQKETEQELAQRKMAISNLMKAQPDIFPPDAESLLAEEKEFLKSEFKQIPILDYAKAIHNVKTPLLQHVQEKWLNAVSSLGGKVQSLLDFFQRNSRLYTLLLASSQKRTHLDAIELYIPQEMQKQDGLSISDIMDFYSEVTRTCFNQANGLKVSPDIISRKGNLETKLNLLGSRSADIKAMDTVDFNELKSQIDFDIKKLSIQLENVDWTKLSKLDDAPLSSLFNFSPPRVVDTTKVTGLTPAITGYLPSLLPTSGKLDVSRASATAKFSSSRHDGFENSLHNPVQIVVTQKQTAAIIRQSPAAQQDNCDSPISHLPSKKIEPVSLHSRNSRRSSLSKFRLSLAPPVEDDEFATKDQPKTLEKNGTSRKESAHELVESMETSASDSQDRIKELLKCFADAAIDTPMDQRLTKVRAKRRSSLYLKGDKMDESCNQSSIEDLEILGIMDVTVSYADILDLSIEYDENEDV